MEFQAALKNYTERSTAILAEAPQMDEANTKRKLIEPLLDVLGYDVLTPEVELEYSVQMGVGTKKVDYALLVDDTPVVFIEAKGCDTTLSDGNRDQLTSYMRQVGVDWGILTNGTRFQIYRRDREAAMPTEERLADAELSDLPAHQTLLRALQKDVIASGESQAIADKLASVRSAIGKLQSQKPSIAQEVSDVVAAATNESISQEAEDEAKAFVDSLIATLEGQTHGEHSAQHSVTTPDASQSSPTPSTETDATYRIRMTQNGETVHTAGGDSQVSAMVSTVEYLLAAEDLADAVDVPYVPGTGRGSRALLNTTPTHTDGESMIASRELSNGWYLFTNLSADAKQSYLSEIIELADLQAHFEGDW